MSKNFNYISFGDWDYIRESGNDISMSRGRMFEYTATDIERRLEGLEPAAIDFLEKLPSFLCSEIECSSNACSMLIKYGLIGRTRADKREVSTHFNPIIDFGEVEFENVRQACQIFGADSYQLYRTHWAVREGDAADVLENLANLNQIFRSYVDRLQVSDIAALATEPPPRQKKIIGTANSVESFLAHLYGFPASATTENFFRGHEDSKFELTPSLFRKGSNGAWQYMPHEDRLCKELLIAHYDDFQGDQYCFDRLVRMQHYGLPTRLLDISSNPLVALFFLVTAMRK